MATEVEYVNYKDFVAGLESTENPGVTDKAVVCNETDGPRVVPANTSALSNTATDSDLNAAASIELQTASGKKKAPANLFAKQSGLETTNSNVTALSTYAQNVAHSIAPEFDPTRDSEHAYPAGYSVMYTDGKVYTFTAPHYGAWTGSDVYERPESESLQDIGGSILDNGGIEFVSYSAGVVQFPIKSGRKYVIYNQNTSGAVTFSTRSYPNGSTVDGTFEISAGGNHEFTASSEASFVRFNAAVNAKVLDVLGHTYRIAKIEKDVESLPSLQTNVDALHREIEVSSETTGVGKNYDYKFIKDQKYKVIITGGPVNVYSRTGNSNVEQIADNKSNMTIDFTAAQNADMLRVFYTSTASVKVIYDKVDSFDIPHLQDNVDAVRTSFGVSGSTTGAVNYNYQFKYGKRYKLIVTGGHTVNLYTRTGSSNVETIATDVKDTIINFVCNADAELLRVYYSGTASVEVVWDKIDNFIEVGDAVLDACPPDYMYDNETLVPPSVTSGNVARYYDMWDNIVTAHPDFLTKSVIGRDESDTYDINCYTLKSYSDNIRSTLRINKNKKIIWVTDLHGDERKAAMSVYLFAKELLENRGNSKHLQMLWNNCEFIFIPLANPWGYENNSRYNYNGVNLNRNFGYNWVLDPDGPNTYNYGGASAMSESETQAVDSVIQANLDAFVCINHHNSVQIGSEGRAAYVASRFLAEKDIQQMVARVADGVLKNKYPWLLSLAANKKRNLLINTNVPSDNHGTMDDYVSMSLGRNCYLLEIPQYAEYPDSGSYTGESDLDLQNMAVSIAVNYLVGYVVKNKLIAYDRRRITE